jgi:hypothetical protein
VNRRVFFSFHYERDIWRVSQVRNSGVVLPPGATSAGFIDAAAWHSLERQGAEAIRRWIDEEMNGTSVTVVLIGTETAKRPWVNYEIRKSVDRGNGLLGVYIHNVKDSTGRTDARGENPFDALGLHGFNAPRTYDWAWDDGRRNLAAWIETAANAAGR